jgi:hypothetical protein
VIRTSAFTRPFASLVVPANASRKLALGSAMEVLPPRTTRPVILMLLVIISAEFHSMRDRTTHKISVPSLTKPITSENRMESLLLDTPTIAH